jgi:hypothetical protein
MDPRNDRVHIKYRGGLFGERLTLGRPRDLASGLLQKSVHERPWKEKASDRLVCLEFPPSASVRLLFLHQDVFRPAQDAPLVFSELRRSACGKERSVQKTVTRLVSDSRSYSPAGWCRVLFETGKNLGAC